MKKRKMLTSFLLCSMLCSGIAITANAETNSFNEVFNLSKTGYTGNQTKDVTGLDASIYVKSFSGCSSFTATLVNSNNSARSNAKTINLPDIGPWGGKVPVFSTAQAGYWYKFKMVVPTLGSKISGTFDVG
ncbi:hypothetical protein [uncultured Clostridium sp.]|uniref:hypothetical protein n=1 Tax=uncultured Clostridium sp. TaxID=59620 RepID=UPI0025940639|nr:hypothetical protein [uncultured Clostridium sp.]